MAADPSRGVNLSGQLSSDCDLFFHGALTGPASKTVKAKKATRKHEVFGMDTLVAVDKEAAAPVPLRTQVADLLAWTARLGALKPHDLLKAVPTAVYTTDAAGRINF